MADCKRLNIVNGVETDLIHTLDRGLLYGDGLFETIAVIGGAPRLLNLHLARLSTGLERLCFPAVDLDSLRLTIVEYAQRFEQAVLKVIITRGQSDRGYPPPALPALTTIISITEYQYSTNYADYLVRHLAICDTTLSVNPLLAGIKHLNRLEQVMAGHECARKQFSDCVLLDTRGRVVEAVSANIFAWQQNRLFTPALDNCGIKGVMREKIIELATLMKIPVETGPMTIEQLKTAEAVFLANSIKPIQPVATVDSVALDQANWPTDLFKEVMHHVCS